FPLPRSSFQQVRPYVRDHEPHPWYREFYGNGFGFVIAVWIGPHASPRKHHAAWGVGRSLRFPGLRGGTNSQRSFYVLGKASPYPLGPATMIPHSALPHSSGLGSHVPDGFYLIHAPRAFYVIKRQFQSTSRPYTKCTLAFDRKVFQFYCPGTNLRWNRIGE